MKSRRKKSIRAWLYETHGGRCFYCRVQTSFHCSVVQKPTDGTIDHIIPHSRGGRINRKNTVWACRACNERRGAKDFVRFGVAMLVAVRLRESSRHSEAA